MQGTGGGRTDKRVVRERRARFISLDGIRRSMTFRCGFCHWTEGEPRPVPGWVEVVQGFMDYQPHPNRVDGLIECDRRVFEDDAWFCVVEREPLAEGHVKLICKHHITGLSQLRGHAGNDLNPEVVDAARSNLLDDLIIAHDVVMGYDQRVVEAVVLSGTSPDLHLYFDLVPVYRFNHGTLHTLGGSASMWDDIPLHEKRLLWEQRRPAYEETGVRLREVAGRVIRSRPGRRRTGLVAGDE
jgi:hypothetical protein